MTPPHFDPDFLLPHSLSTLPLLPPLKPTATPFVTWEAPSIDLPLVFPVFLLFPLNDPPSRDLCLSFNTSSTFGDFLQVMEYDSNLLNLFISTAKGRVLKVGAKLLLGKVLEAARKDGDGWELREGWALEIMGVPKSVEGDQWVAKWKEEVKRNTVAIL